MALVCSESPLHVDGPLCACKGSSAVLVIVTIVINLQRYCVVSLLCLHMSCTVVSAYCVFTCHVELPWVWQL